MTTQEEIRRRFPGLTVKVATAEEYQRHLTALQEAKSQRLQPHYSKLATAPNTSATIDFIEHKIERDRAGVCRACSGAGWVTFDVPLGHPNFGKSVPCKACGPARNKERARRQWANMQIPAILAEVDFESYVALDGLTPAQRENATHIELWASRVAGAMKTLSPLDVKPWLLLSGTGNGQGNELAMGRGKTGLAVAALKKIVLDGEIGGVFISMSLFVKQCRAAMSVAMRAQKGKEDAGAGPDALVLRYASAPILVIDDLGAGHLSDWAIGEILWPIIEDRYNNGYPTIITSNYPFEKIAEKIAVAAKEETAADDARRIMARIGNMTGAGNMIKFSNQMRDLRTRLASG